MRLDFCTEMGESTDHLQKWDADVEILCQIGIPGHPKLQTMVNKRLQGQNTKRTVVMTIDPRLP